MSLKAKLEAVIYAAEEPVTLAQLTSLFAEEALAWKAAGLALRAEAELIQKSQAGRSSVIEFADSATELSELLTVIEGLEEATGMGASEASIAVLGDAAAPTKGSDAEGLSEEPSIEIDPKGDAVLDAALDAALEAKRQEQKRSRDVREILREMLDELIADYANDSRGIEIREIAGGYRMSTKPEIHDAVRMFVKSLKPALKLSLPALETLAVIAYKQPVTAPEVGEIRGVDSAGVLGSLMSRKLITTAGRKQVIGRPILYKTTKEFLLRFGLKDVNELPSMEEFEKIAALELSETDDADTAGESYASAESGELFAETEPSIPSKSPAPESEQQAAPSPSIPTAEPSQEAAEAYAPVERQDAEEEVEAIHEEASQ